MTEKVLNFLDFFDYVGQGFRCRLFTHVLTPPSQGTRWVRAVILLSKFAEKYAIWISVYPLHFAATPDYAPNKADAIRLFWGNYFLWELGLVWVVTAQAD